jgi:hypothetical protein
MTTRGAAIANRHITFCVREHEGQPVQHLTISPVGLIDYTGPCERIYVNLEIRLVMLRSQIVVDDHMTTRSLVRLHRLLLGFQNGVLGSDTFGTADGHLELTVEWREATKDVRFAGRIPAFDYSELVDEPLRLRDGIYRTLSFQFALEPPALTQPIAQLNELLDLLRSLKPQPRDGSE